MNFRRIFRLDFVENKATFEESYYNFDLFLLYVYCCSLSISNQIYVYSTNFLYLVARKQRLSRRNVILYLLPTYFFIENHPLS